VNVDIPFQLSATLTRPVSALAPREDSLGGIPHLMKMKLSLIAVVLVLSADSPPSCAEEQAPQNSLTTIEKIYGLSQFWKEVSYNFAHWKPAATLDWDEAYRRFVPRIMATESDFEYYREMQRFCALLEDGHTNVYLPRGMLETSVGRVPFQLRAIGRRAIVSNMDVALAANVPVGSEVLKVDGTPIEEMVEKEIIPLISTSSPHIYWDMAIRSLKSAGVGVLFGPKGSTASLEIRRPDGDVVTLEIARDQYEREVQWAVKPEKAPLSEFRMLEGDIAYMALNDFSRDEIVPAFRKELPRMAQARGIIIDLRRNGGGDSRNSSAIVGHFTDTPFKGASWRTPVHYGAYRAWGMHADSIEGLEEYRDYYFGHVYHVEEATEHQPSDGIKLTAPTVVLIGRKTASAAEDFLIMADGIDHITYMGERTFGSTGQPLMMDLPGGGSARISTKRDFYPDGREFIGRGVEPDLEVTPTVEAFLSGEDQVLEKAVASLRDGSAP
jgi:C-terminal processing protease CtpA/Prc